MIRTDRFDHEVKFRTTAGFVRAVDIAARREGTTPSEFQRRAILAALREMRIPVLPAATAAECMAAKETLQKMLDGEPTTPEELQAAAEVLVKVEMAEMHATLSSSEGQAEEGQS